MPLYTLRRRYYKPVRWMLRHKKRHPRAHNDYDEETAYESYTKPQTRLPVRPGGLCRRRLDGTLSVSN